MDFMLTEAQVMLQRTVHEFVDRESHRTKLFHIPETPTGYSEEVWKKFAEMGLLGMAIREEYGGSNNGLLDIATVFEELGAGPVYGPFLSTGVLAPMILQECGTDAQRQQFLPAIATGELIVALADTEPDTRWDRDGVQMTAEVSDDDFILTGTKLFVQDGHCADYLITPIRVAGSDNLPDRVVLLMVDTKLPGVSARRLEGFVSGESEVAFSKVRVPSSEVLGERTEDGWDAYQRALIRAIPILCAFQVGGQRTCFEMAVEYSQTRQQFGTPIGRFQHVQNHIVQLTNHMDSARWTTWEAIWRLENNKDSPEISVHAAKAISSDAYIHVTDYAHEVFAGNGTVAEVGLTLFTRMSRSLYHRLGSPGFHRQRLGDLLADRALASRLK